MDTEASAIDLIQSEKVRTIMSALPPKDRWLVEEIYMRQYLMGYSVRKICTGLEGDGIRTARGTSEWHDSTVQGILRNEKYIGDASLQKTYVADLLNHQTKASSSTLPGTDCHRSIAETMTLVSKTA